MARAQKKLKFRISKDGKERSIIEEYCQKAGIDVRDVQYTLNRLSTASRRLFPGEGDKKLKWVCLTYFFAGLNLGRTRPEEATGFIKEHDTEADTQSYIG